MGASLAERAETMGIPEDSRVIRAFREVQSLDAKAITKRIDDELGDAMIAAFSALAQGLHPGEPADRTAERVHLMVLAALISNGSR